MPIDQRHTQIKEGAGLEESRLNVEFIQWLQKWSTPLLIVIAAAALGYVLYHKYHERQESRANEAFASLETVLASANPSPASLLGVADEYAGVRAVPLIARLQAADLYLSAVRRGIDPGAQVDPNTGKLASQSDLMDAAERETTLDEAARLYRGVLEACAGKPELAIHTIGAEFGLASVAECKGDTAGAKGHYEAAAARAREAGFAAQEKIAAERIAGLDSRAQMPMLYSQDALPKLPWVPEAAPDPTAPGVTPSGPAEPAPSEPAPAEKPQEPPAGGEPGSPPPR